MNSNDIFEKIGGRKMALTLFVVIVGALVDILSTNGISANLTGLLVGASAVFGAANAAISLSANKALGITATAAVEAGQDIGDVASGVSQVTGVDRHEELVTAVDNISKESSLRIDSQQAALEALFDRIETQEKAMETATKLLKAMLTIKSEG